MTLFEIITTVSLGLVFLSTIWLITEFNGMKKDIREKTGINNETIKLQLQAYERLTLLSERISLPDLISRVPNTGLSCRQMQISLIDAIKSEYDYNLSQQVYVSSEAWRAVNNLKEQNIYLINQIASSLPMQASGMDLNKHVMEYLMNNSRASLHTVVLEALNFEAKKIM